MKKLAYFDTSHEMPLEIIMAAGFTPFKILGDVQQSNDPADKYLSSFFCPAARSWLTEALAHSKEWAGIIFAQGCNNTNRHYDIWKVHVETPFLHWFGAPLLESAAAKKYYRVELQRLISHLENQFGIKITSEKIREAIGKSNEIKKKLQQLSALRSIKDVSNRDYLAAMIKCLTESADEVSAWLDSEIKDWNSKPAFPSDKKRFLLTGSDVTYVEWMDTLEDCGIRIIRDDLSVGERFFATLIPDRNDPLDAFMEYYMNIPKPATRPTIQQRLDYLYQALGETKVDGVLSQNVKFCEPYAYDSVPVNNALKDKGYKVIHLERDFSPAADQQLANRLAAFVEMMEVGNNG
jgi:benzoyl-CoA reductase/2-hydroxyglutaryl-CoA dehydratase subunit BcrC/BadD/HgdB